ncbi:CHC2 zinc finger domain-containing protein [Streptomyces sp. NPDC006355]|uniref:CHC2 zinc finger domain-containing protein n=1 Tax=Streptomyces sp. NPDC006355 TaxID=3156758 RepID=UPI0033B1A3F5
MRTTAVTSFGSTPPKPSIVAVFEEFYPEVEIPDWGGTWRKILCPLHVEDRPSASVNPEANRWHCHACDISEDSWSVIMREEGIGFREAIKWADARFGGGSEAVPEPVQREPSRGIPDRPRFGRGRRQVASRVRRFGQDRS